MFQDIAVVVGPALLHTPSFMVELIHVATSQPPKNKKPWTHDDAHLPTVQQGFVNSLYDSLAYRLNGEVLT